MSAALVPGYRLMMIRENLEEIPQFDLPAGFKLRSHLPGDQARWMEIHIKADRYNTITPNLFQEQFGSDPAQLKERQCYLIAPDGGVIGTATAWFGKDNGANGLGRVHWVALLPEFQGRGLSKALLQEICMRLRALGHTGAYLSTCAERKPAIGLYLRFGFKPWIHNEQEREIWEKLLLSV
jgi:GNAT superfamily N-acetyltransferase